MNIMQELFDGGTHTMQKRKRLTFKLICITFVIFVLLLALFAGCLAVEAIIKAINKNTPDPDKPITIDKTEAVVLDEAQLYSGTLLLLDDGHSLQAKSDVVLMKTIERPKTAGGTNAYTIGSMDRFSGTQEAIKALNSMIAAFYKATKDDNIYIANAYDTYYAQDALFATGTAFELDHFSAADIEDWSQKASIYGASTYNWIYNNAHKYGFIVAEGYRDSNVFRYIGVANAMAMKSSKLSFEDYLESLKDKTPEAPLTVKSGTVSYAIYYLSAKGEHRVPTDYKYTVSGNNADGYIVTVQIPKNS